jgi:hypothetical protein
MKMTIRKMLLAAVALLMMSTMAAAADEPKQIGTWTLKSGIRNLCMVDQPSCQPEPWWFIDDDQGDATLRIGCYVTESGGDHYRHVVVNLYPDEDRPLKVGDLVTMSVDYPFSPWHLTLGGFPMKNELAFTIAINEAGVKAVMHSNVINFASPARSEPLRFYGDRTEGAMAWLLLRVCR